MKFLLLAFLILDPQNTQTIMHEVPSEKACDGYAEQLGRFRNLSVTKLSGYSDTGGFLSFNQKSLRYKCVPLDEDGVPRKY